MAIKRENKINSQLKLRPRGLSNAQRRLKNIEPLRFSEEISEISGGKEEKGANLFS